MKYVAAMLVITLLIAHQDYWQWDRHELVFGFIPYNMAWHIGLSMVTTMVWVAICLVCWPKQPGDFPENEDSKSTGSEDGIT